LLPKYLGDNKRTSFVVSYKLWVRKWDSAEKIMLKLI
jgi:hypothetical protein